MRSLQKTIVLSILEKDSLIIRTKNCLIKPQIQTKYKYGKKFLNQKD